MAPIKGAALEFSKTYVRLTTGLTLFTAISQGLPVRSLSLNAMMHHEGPDALPGGMNLGYPIYVALGSAIAMSKTLKSLQLNEWTMIGNRTLEEVASGIASSVSLEELEIGMLSPLASRLISAALSMNDSLKKVTIAGSASAIPGSQMLGERSVEMPLSKPSPPSIVQHT